MFPLFEYHILRESRFVSESDFFALTYGAYINNITSTGQTEKFYFETG